jgi:hypothetical protein
VGRLRKTRGRPSSFQAKPRDGEVSNSKTGSDLFRKAGCHVFVHEPGLHRIVAALAGANPAPITAAQLRATEMLLFGEEYRGSFGDAAIAQAIKKLGSGVDKEANVLTVTHGIPIWRAMTILYFRAIKGKRAA